MNITILPQVSMAINDVTIWKFRVLSKQKQIEKTGKSLKRVQ